MEGRPAPLRGVLPLARALGLVVVLIAAVAAAVVAFALPAEDRAPSAPAPTPTAAVTAETVDVLVLGDSIGTGAGATTTYADQLVDRLDAPVDTRNLARNGWTTGDLLSALRTDPLFRDAVAGADLVTVSIGGNDLLQARSAFVGDTCGGVDGLDCVRSAVSALGARWAEIADELVALSGSDATIATMTLYDPFDGADVAPAADEALATQLAAANAAISETAATHGFALAPVADAFAAAPAAGLIAADGIHPSDAGHALIADAFAEALPDRIAPS